MAALIVALLPMIASIGTAQSFVLTTIGAYAVVSGVLALRSAVWPHRQLKRLLALIGVTTGSIATLLMVFQLVVFYVSTGSTAPPMPFAFNPPAQVQGESPFTSSAGSATPTVEAPSQGMSAEMQMVQTLGTLSFTLAQSQADDGSWPQMLGTTSAGEVFVALPRPETRTLVILPPDTELSYWTSTDRRTWGARLSSLTTPGLAVVYDSVSGVVTTS